MTDKGSHHSYLELYEPLFHAFRNTATDVLEIGIGDGSSLQLWYNWFPKALITGVDITHSECNDQRIRCVQGDIKSESVIAFLRTRAYDIIIDDGSHLLAEQIIALTKLMPALKPHGLYVIEDIQYWNSSVEDQFRSVARIINANMIVLDRRDIKNIPDDILLIFQRN